MRIAGFSINAFLFSLLFPRRSRAFNFLNRFDRTRGSQLVFKKKAMAVSLFTWALLSTAASAASTLSDLVGTWTTTSRSVITGPGFYDPISDRLIEPKLTGFSYSFTADGHYEEAYYRAIANPSDPSCPEGIMQWQHGTFVMGPDGSLTLTPIAVDGRQLLSQPCNNPENGIYTRYNQTETFERFDVYTDKFHNVLRLDLYGFNGAPLNPMYLVYRPPEMLPTQTLNPVVTVTPSAKAKRHLAAQEVGSPFGTLQIAKRSDPLDGMLSADKWWWLGVFMTTVGGFLYLFF